MKTLNQQETQFLSGAGAIKDGWEEVREIIRDLPDAYEDA